MGTNQSVSKLSHVGPSSEFISKFEAFIVPKRKFNGFESFFESDESYQEELSETHLKVVVHQ